MTDVSIKNFTRSSLGGSRAVFSTMAASILPAWNISLVFVGSKRARDLNKRLRGKTYTPNVLSYEVGKKSGEIFICLQEAKKQAPLHSMSEKTFVFFLFIHGLLHLKGWAHGVRMERCEQKLLAQFINSHVATYSNRNRHRHVPDKNGRGRGTD
jgi:probable rRNA maturation factor